MAFPYPCTILCCYLHSPQLRTPCRNGPPGSFMHDDFVLEIIY